MLIRLLVLELIPLTAALFVAVRCTIPYGAAQAEMRRSGRFDALLVDAQGIGANLRGATNDRGDLRAEVEANPHKVEGMIDQLNRKWPFAKDTGVKLP